MKYVCSLYSLNAKTDSAQDIATRQHRYEYTMCRVASLLKQGEMVYSPILHCHNMSIKYDLPKDYKFWQAIDNHMIDICDSIIVLKMDDGSSSWVDSVGINDEINYAISKGKKIEYLDCDDFTDANEG